MVQSEKDELTARVAELDGELKDLETQLLAMEQSATENADIAGQWKDRSDAFEAQLEAERAERSTSEAALRQRITALETRLETAQAERRKAEGAASRAGSPMSAGGGRPHLLGRPTCPLGRGGRLPGLPAPPPPPRSSWRRSWRSRRRTWRP